MWSTQGLVKLIVYHGTQKWLENVAIYSTDSTSQLLNSRSCHFATKPHNLSLNSSLGGIYNFSSLSFEVYRRSFFSVAVWIDSKRDAIKRHFLSYLVTCSFIHFYTRDFFLSTSSLFAYSLYLLFLWLFSARIHFSQLLHGKFNKTECSVSGFHINIFSGCHPYLSNSVKNVMKWQPQKYLAFSLPLSFYLFLSSPIVVADVNGTFLIFAKCRRRRRRR